MKNTNKIVKLFVICFSAFAMSACQKTTANNDYTYHEAFGYTPSEWNPHILSQDASNSVHYLSSMGWVAMGMGANKEYTWLYEMADSITDITSSFSQKEKFHISDGETNRVYEIKLNQNATWENGVKINADTYIYSMKQLLNYDLKNPISATYLDKSPAIMNAKEYMYSGKNFYGYLSFGDETTTSNNHYFYNDLPVYYSLTDINPMLNCSLKDFRDSDPGTYGDVYQHLVASANEDGFILLTSDLLVYLKQFAALLGNEAFWIVLVACQDQYHATWEDVGFIKVDEYTLHYVLKNACPLQDLYSFFSNNFLVYEPLYEAGKVTKEGLTTTNYATSVKTYMSYGPYKLVSFEAGKQMVFKKNDKWYGYSDGKHEGMYQTTSVVYNVIPSHETELSAFLSGKIEKTSLNATDMKTYKFSEHLLKADESFIFYLCMNSNIEKLADLETAAGDGSNKKVGAYKSFREALSFAINRLNFVDKGTAGSKVQFGLFNTLYYYDALNDPSSIYRTSEYGMKAIVDHYQVQYGNNQQYKTLQEAYQSINGYDLNKARSLFQQTYEQMKEDGNYTDGQLIKLNCVASDQASLTEEKIMQQNLLNEYIASATQGTGFEGKISIRFMVSANQTMDKDFSKANVEMILTQKSGKETSPFEQIEKYTNKNNYTVPEIASYDPTTEKMTLTIEGETIEKTILDWSKSIRATGTYGDNIQLRVMILSKIEQYLLDNYVDIPLYSRCNVFLNSKKINQGTKNYNLYYGFGGIPYITYNYNDAAWAKYVKQNHNEIKYV